MLHQQVQINLVHPLHRILPSSNKKEQITKISNTVDELQPRTLYRTERAQTQGCNCEFHDTKSETGKSTCGDQNQHSGGRWGY